MLLWFVTPKNLNMKLEMLSHEFKCVMQGQIKLQASCASDLKKQIRPNCPKMNQTTTRALATGAEAVGTISTSEGWAPPARKSVNGPGCRRRLCASTGLFPLVLP